MATSTQPYGKLLEYEQYIEHQLSRTQARIKMTDVLTACLGLFAALLGVLFLEVVLDHAVGLPVWVRRIVLFCGLSGTLAFTALRIVRPLVRRVNGLYAAKTIEDADPKFKNSLISYLELRRRRKEISKAAMAAIEARAVNDLTAVEIDTVVNQRRLTKIAYTLSAVVVAFCLYAAFTPKSILDSARRALLADVVRPTNTRLLNLKPGDARVVAGTHVEFAVETQGARPGRGVNLHYSVDGGKFFSVAELAPGKNLYDPWQLTLRNVQQSMLYYLSAGDGETRRYQLEVMPAPMVTSVLLDYEFPAYTGVPPRTGVEGGNVEAIEGTKVTVHAATNEPAQRGTLDFAKADSAPPAMEVAPDNDHELLGRFTVKESGTYTIKFRTTGGQVNPDPVVYDVTAIPDRAPTARIVKPEQPEIKVPANVKVPVEVTASDDHGVKDVTLHVHQGADILQPAEDLLEGKPPTKEFQGVETIDLAKLQVKPGAKVEYWLTVRDNKEPQSNRFETARQIIQVVAPVSQSEKSKRDEETRREVEQAKKHQQEQQQAQTSETEANPERPANAGPEDDTAEGKPEQPAKGEKDGQVNERANQTDRGAAEQPDKANPQQPAANPEDAKQLKALQDAFAKADQQKQQQQTGKGASGAQPANPNAGKPTPDKQTGQKQPAEATSPGAKSPQSQRQSNQNQNAQTPNTTPGAPQPQPSPGNENQPGDGPSDVVRADRKPDQNGANPNAPKPKETGAQAAPRTKDSATGNKPPNQGGAKPSQPEKAGETPANPNGPARKQAGRGDPQKQKADGDADKKNTGNDPNGPAGDQKSAADPKSGHTDAQTPNPAKPAEKSEGGKPGQPGDKKTDNANDTPKNQTADQKPADGPAGAPDAKDSQQNKSDPTNANQAGTKKDAAGSQTQKKAVGAPNGGPEKKAGPSGKDQQSNPGNANDTPKNPDANQKPADGASDPNNAKDPQSNKSDSPNANQTGQKKDATGDQAAAGPQKKAAGAPDNEPGGDPKQKAGQLGKDPKSKQGAAGKPGDQKPEGPPNADGQPGNKDQAQGDPSQSAPKPNGAKGAPTSSDAQKKDGSGNPADQPKSPKAADGQSTPGTPKPGKGEQPSKDGTKPGDANGQKGEPPSSTDKPNATGTPPGDKASGTSTPKPAPAGAAPKADPTNPPPQSQPGDGRKPPGSNPEKSPSNPMPDQTGGKPPAETGNNPNSSKPDAKTPGNPSPAGEKSNPPEAATTKGQNKPQPANGPPRGAEDGSQTPDKPAQPSPADSPTPPKSTQSKPAPAQSNQDSASETGGEGQQTGEKGKPSAKAGPQGKPASQPTPDGQPSDGNGGEKPQPGKSGAKPGSKPGDQEGQPGPAGEQGQKGKSGQTGKPGGEQGANQGATPQPGEKPGTEAGKPGGEGAQTGGQQPGGKEPGGEKGGQQSGGKPSGGEKGGQQPGDKPGASDAKGGPEGGRKPAQKGGEGTGKQPDGKDPSGGGKAGGGGGGSAPGGPGGPMAPDTTKKPSPRAESPEQNADETVAPKNVPQSDFVLRRLEEMLKNDRVPPELEKETGMNREQMEQFVEKFKKAPKSEPGPARDIKVKGDKPGQALPPNRNLPGFNPGNRFSTSTIKDRGSVAQDNVRDNIEGARLVAPRELQSRFEGYMSTLSRSKTANPVPAGR